MFKVLLFALFLQQEPGPEKVYAFIVSGDPQYVAEEVPDPSKLDSASETSNNRFIERMRRLPGSEFPGGRVAEKLLGILVTGDLIDSGDKNGRKWEAMQRVEWARYKEDYGPTVKGARIPFPAYEVHGNHDSVRGDGIVLPEIRERNRVRAAVVNRSEDGLHYSWDWGPIHLVACGIFVGEGMEVREGHHYNPVGSLEFLREDLERHVGDSGRPVMVAHHLHLTAGDYDWPNEDRDAYYALLRKYNVLAVFHGHTHGNPSRVAWSGGKPVSKGPGIPVFNPDDSGASKASHPGMNHGFLYVEVRDRAGVEGDSMKVWFCRTRDAWETVTWGELKGDRPVRIPDLQALRPRRR